MIKTSVLLQSNKGGEQYDEQSPQSPLFAFSQDADDSDRETTVFAGSLGEHDGPGDSPPLDVSDAQARSSQECPRLCEGSQSSPDASSVLSAGLPGEHGADSSRLGKRTAHDAFLSDTESGDEKDKFNKGKMALVDTDAVSRSRSAQSMRSTHSSCSDEKLVDKPSMIPKPATRAGLAMPEESDACMLSSSKVDVHGANDEYHVEGSDLDLVSEKDAASKELSVPGTSPSKVLTGSPGLMDPELPTSVGHTNMEDTPTSESSLPRAVVPEVAEKFQGSRIETAMAKPHLETRDDILFLKCPKNSRLAVYKVTLTVSLFLKESSTRGWHELVIPGLPKTIPEDSGTFLFLIPEDKGIEFDTRNLQRYEIVENCFFAEFISHGDLVIPLRLRDSKSHGIQEFTVEQEIRAVCRVDSTAGGTQDGQSNLVVQYHAVCSIKLHHRCVWAEQCSFFLDLDGGPEGSFQYELEAQTEGLKVVYIPTPDNPCIGVSHIKIICSPRDFGLFCLAWTVKAPIRQAMSWLPRVFPATTGPYGQERYELRHKLTELDPVSHIDNNGTEVGETEADERPIPNPIHQLHAPPSSTDSEISMWLGSTSQTNESTQQGIYEKLLLGATCVCVLVFSLVLAILLNVFYFRAVVCQDDTCAVDQYHTSLTFSCSTAANVLQSSENELVETYGYLEDLTLDLESDQVSVEASDDGSPDTVEPGEIRTKPAETPSGESYTNSETESPAAPQLSLRDRIDYWLGWTGPDPDA